MQGDPNAAARDFWAKIADDPSEAGVHRAMIENYRGMSARFARALPQVVDLLLDPGGPPVLIHCHAGKDRTGFACAVILFAVGVDEGAIREDYLRTLASADAIAEQSVIATAAERRLGFRLEPAACSMIEKVRPDYLDAALAAVRADHGSMSAYLERVGRLDEGKRSRLRARLLVAPTEAEQCC